MTELSDLVAGPLLDQSSPFRVARVISVNRRVLTVDFGSGVAGTVVQAVASCNPRPDDNVFIAMDGNRPVALGVMGDPYRQATIKVDGASSTVVLGQLNGVATNVTKAGAFDVTIGDVLPLVWSADGSGVWVLAKPGAAYVPPPSTGGGGSGGGSTPGSYTTTYAATMGGFMAAIGPVAPAAVVLDSVYGFYTYGNNRLNELQGRSILRARINLPRTSGSGSVTVRSRKGGSVGGSSTVGTGGWVSLPTARVNELIAGSGLTDVRLYGTGTLAGTPNGGTLQVTWR